MATETKVQRPEWLASLLEPDAYSHPVQKIRLFETHISWVLLTGEWAYKLKKPVNLGFVNFTTLELRHQACLDELRLNRRTAPDLYEDVIPLTETSNGPQFGATGSVVEYAVRMHQFPDADRLDRCLERNELTREKLDELAREIADLHFKAEVAKPDTGFGGPTLIRETVKACIDALTSDSIPNACRPAVKFLTKWTEAEWRRLRPTFDKRKRKGFVRECHGDLHLGNLVMIDGKPTLFDCLEFNAELRWVDVLSDIAFLVMDLQDRGMPDESWYLFNRYLERTGDFDGLIALPYFLTYRALVRAKVAAIRLGQTGVTDKECAEQQRELRNYLSLAEKLTKRHSPVIVLTNGVCGSGKTGMALTLAASLPAIHIRSDVERKRLAGLWSALDRDIAELDEKDLYSAKVSTKTYERLQRLTQHIVRAGFSVIVDAAFLKRSQRSLFTQGAGDLSVPIVVVSCTAPKQVLEERVRKRQSQGQDASDGDVEVLHQQLEQQDPPLAIEATEIIVVDTTNEDRTGVIERIRARTADER